MNPWILIGRGNGKGRPALWVLMAQQQAKRLARRAK